MRESSPVRGIYLQETCIGSQVWSTADINNPFKSVTREVLCNNLSLLPHYLINHQLLVLPPKKFESVHFSTFPLVLPHVSAISFLVWTNTKLPNRPITYFLLRSKRSLKSRNLTMSPLTPISTVFSDNFRIRSRFLPHLEHTSVLLLPKMHFMSFL